MPDPSPADDLYGLDPTEFTAARDALARVLRADGRRDEAAEVKKLRRPPQSVWALNLLARSEPELVDDVLESATALRDALADPDGDRRAAQAVYREAIDAAVAAAADRAGVTGDDMRTRIRTNLLAAGVDEAVARQLQRGVLPDDQEAPGFGGAPTIGPLTRRTAPAPKPAGRRPAARRPAPSDGSKDDSASRSKDDSKDRSSTASEDRAAAAAARAAAEADELARRRSARQRAELEREITRLERRTTRLTGQAETAEARADELRTQADAATAELDDARRRLADL